MAKKKIIFIGGCPRSGTTMLGSIIGSAEGCVVTPESQFKQTLLQNKYKSLSSEIDRDYLFSEMRKNFRFRIWQIALPERSDYSSKLTLYDYSRFIGYLVDEYAEACGLEDWQTWVDHTPQNIQNPLMLMHLFPESKFIHLVRDPRAIAASVLPLNWGPNSSKEAAIFWAQKLAHGLSLEKSHPTRCLRVHYEDIVQTPHKTISEICAFCDLDYKESMQLGGAFRMPKYTQNQHRLVGSNPDLSRIEAWRDKLTMWEIFDIEKTLGDLLPQQGYEPSKWDYIPNRPLSLKARSIFMPVISFIRKIRFKVKKKMYGSFLTN